MEFRKLRVAHFSRVVELFFVLSKPPTGSGSDRDFSLLVLKIRGGPFFTCASLTTKNGTGKSVESHTMKWGILSPKKMVFCFSRPLQECERLRRVAFPSSMGVPALLLPFSLDESSVIPCLGFWNA